MGIFDWLFGNEETPSKTKKKTNLKRKKKKIYYEKNREL
tara:strand:- start:252 stop:368 length:117 start_codon:yes stop_codon:yes gene_type:complete